MGMFRTVGQQGSNSPFRVSHVKHKRAIRQQRVLRASPLFIWKTDVYKNCACSSRAADFRKEWSPFFYFLKRQISICPRGLNSKTFAPHTTANLSNYITGWRTIIQIPSPETSAFQSSCATTPKMRPWKLHLIARLPSPKFRKLPAAFVKYHSFFHVHLN